MIKPNKLSSFSLNIRDIDLLKLNFNRSQINKYKLIKKTKIDKPSLNSRMR